MSSSYTDCISNIRPGKYEWTIKVRVIRCWRNYTKEGKLVKGFNMLLLDDKNISLSAFVPGTLIEKYESMITVGDVFKISNFLVKHVTDDKINLMTHNDKEIQFTGYTKVTEVDDDDGLIPINRFDFYEISDLEPMLNHNRYLLDVIGVVDNYQPPISWKGKKDPTAQKTLINFSVNDGSASIPVRLWDSYAEKFHKLYEEATEHPRIVIITGCRVVLLDDVLQLATVSSTSFYLNYNHHRVAELRRMICTPEFSQQVQSTQQPINTKIYTIEELKQLDQEFLNKKVIMHLTIKKFQTMDDWLIYECSSCQEEVTDEGGVFFCSGCKRTILYPDEKISVPILCSDHTGTIGIILNDREARRLTGTTLSINRDNVILKGRLPQFLKSILNMDITAVVEVGDDNIKRGSIVFNMAEAIKGHFLYVNPMPVNSKEGTYTTETSTYTEVSTSSANIHLTNLQLTTPHPPKEVLRRRKEKL